MQTELVTIFGKHAVNEALRSRPDVVREIYISEEGAPAEFASLIQKYGIKQLPLSPKRLKDLPPDAVHQGIAAGVDSAALMQQYDEFISQAAITNDAAFILLGEVQDPQNVGSIIRSAAAFGVSAILFPQHRQVQVSGTVVKVSAGMAFKVPLVSIGNVNTTIADLKERGFWTYGLAGEAPQSVYDEGFEKPSVFIVGNEATGIREKTLEHCDIPLKIPMHAQTESLNASIATAIVLSAWSKYHPGALK